MKIKKAIKKLGRGKSAKGALAGMKLGKKVTKGKKPLAATTKPFGGKGKKPKLSAKSPLRRVKRKTAAPKRAATKMKYAKKR